MSILASYASRVMGAPLHANYSLKGAERITNTTELWEMNNGIFCFDEMWLTLDARLWKDNVFLTRFINQTRKKKLVIFYTTQHIRQIELRARNATDLLIYCEKTPQGHWLQFIDWQYRTMGKRYLISAPRPFYSLYDTYEVLEPLKATKKGNFSPSGYSMRF